ncbi:uncharacterized protein BJ171DRAFT_405933, partial [Polychytrium aggregatum]|uniref:uncharacterized protein n=1 Tax=Polychytrium aggregatum TaxID=110093 RepID=UPI0022FF305C
PSAIRPFACELCTKAFFRRQDLRRHMVTHSDLPKAFACSLCHSRFTRSDALFRH